MAVTSFIPELWSARLLYALEKAHVATNFVNRNYEGQIKAAGDTVHINTIGDISVASYVDSTGITTSELATTDNTLVIDQAKYFSFAVPDIGRAQAAGNLIDTATSLASYALNDAADSFIFAQLAANGTELDSVALSASNIYETIVNMRLKMDKANVPTAGRVLAVTPEAYAFLLQDDRFTKVASQSEQVVRTGMVGEVAGFQVYESNNLNSYLIADVTEAATYAEQILNVESMRMENRFADQVRGLHVYGAKVTRSAAVIAQPVT